MGTVLFIIIFLFEKALVVNLHIVTVYSIYIMCIYINNVCDECDSGDLGHNWKQTVLLLQSKVSLSLYSLFTCSFE